MAVAMSGCGDDAGFSSDATVERPADTTPRDQAQSDLSADTQGDPMPGEPVFDAGVDQLVYQDDFDAYATIDARFTRLQTLRSGSGNHAPFISDNRYVDNPGPEFYELHQIVAGRGGSGWALRSRFPNSAAQQISSWVDWPTGSVKYSPESAAFAMQVYIRISPGWAPGNPGFKWMEFWLKNVPACPGGNCGRIQSSWTGRGLEWRWDGSPNGDTGNFGAQPHQGEPEFSALADGQWHLWTWLYKPAAVLGDQTGVFRIWVDGRKMADLSALGVTEGFCTSADVARLPHLAVRHFKFPDVLVSVNRPEATIDYDDFKWWVER